MSPRDVWKGVASLWEWWLELPIWMAAPLALIVLAGFADAAFFVVMKVSERRPPDG